MALILVVDDEPLVGRMVREALAPHEVVLAGDGESGLSFVESSKPDLVLLDLNMPEPDGNAVLARMPPVHPPVILMTGYVGTMRPEFGDRVFSVLKKPFDLADLRVSVSVALKKTHPEISV